MRLFVKCANETVDDGSVDALLEDIQPSEAGPPQSEQSAAEVAQAPVAAPVTQQAPSEVHIEIKENLLRAIGED